MASVTLAAVLFGYDPFDSATWSRWDSIHYQEIASNGYDLVSCPAGYAPGAWCGDAGWFPAYSWLVGGLHLLGLPLRGTAVSLSWLFAGATLWLLWDTFLQRRRTAATLIVLAYAAFVPGQIYDYALFPLSMLSFFTVASLWLLHRGRWAAAGAAGAVAALAYPLGVLLAPVSAVWILTCSGVALRERLRRTAWASGLTLAGFGVLLVDQQLETGHWDAYFLVQEKYGHHLQNPIAYTRFAVSPLWHGSPLDLADVPALQTALVTIVLVSTVVYVIARRQSLDRVYVLLALWAVATWAVPLSQNNVSIPRSQAALLPLALLVGRLPRPLAIAIVLAAVAIAIGMEKLFLQGVLV